MTHRHTWTLPPTADEMEVGDWLRHCPCGRREHPESTAKARSSVRLGKDQERRIEKLYGPTKIGERGDAIDLLGKDFKWQSRSTRGKVPDYLALLEAPALIKPYLWITDPFKAMKGLHTEQAPLLIKSYVHVGMPVKDFIVVYASDWYALHGWPLGQPAVDDLLVMTGIEFLTVHGRDEAG